MAVREVAALEPADCSREPQRSLARQQLLWVLAEQAVCQMALAPTVLTPYFPPLQLSAEALAASVIRVPLVQLTVLAVVQAAVWVLVIPQELQLGQAPPVRGIMVVPPLWPHNMERAVVVEPVLLVEMEVRA